MVIKSRKEAAAALGITERALGYWKNEAGFPDCSKGHDIEAIKAWRNQGERKGSEVDQQMAVILKRTRFAKMEEAQNKVLLQKIELERANRELLPRDVVHDLLMECAAIIRGLGNQLQRSGNLTAARLIDEQMDRFGKTVNDRLRNATRDAGK